MTKIQNTKQYDLEERTFQFAKNVALYVKQLPRNISNLEYGEQVSRLFGFSWLQLYLPR